MEFERVPLPGWSWSVWSEQQAAATSPPSSRWRRRQQRQQVDEPTEPAVHGSRWSASEFETADGRSELDAAAAARRQRWQRRRYERAKQQPSGPGPPAAAASSFTATVPCADATVHVSWQRRRRRKFRIAATTIFGGPFKRRPGQSWRWDAKQQRRLQQYATKLCRGRRHESSSVSWIKLFADAVGW